MSRTDTWRGGKKRGGSELTMDPACAAPKEDAESGDLDANQGTQTQPASSSSSAWTRWWRRSWWTFTYTVVAAMSSSRVCISSSISFWVWVVVHQLAHCPDLCTDTLTLLSSLTWGIFFCDGTLVDGKGATNTVRALRTFCCYWRCTSFIVCESCLWFATKNDNCPVMNQVQKKWR